MPRITITLSDQQHQLFQAVSKYSGKPMSTTIAELLDAANPVLQRMATVFQRIHEQQQQERARITNELQQAQDSLEPIAAQMLNQFDLFLSKVAPDTDKQADLGKGAPACGVLLPKSAQPAPRTNRGDTPPLEITPNTAPNKARRSVRTREVFEKK
jgi:hypothetical protein